MTGQKAFDIILAQTKGSSLLEDSTFQNLEILFIFKRGGLSLCTLAGYYCETCVALHSCTFQYCRWFSNLPGGRSISFHFVNSTLLRKRPRCFTHMHTPPATVQRCVKILRAYLVWHENMFYGKMAERSQGGNGLALKC